MTDKNSMIIYHEWLEFCEDLTDSELGQMFRAMVAYDKTAEKPEFSDRLMRTIWRRIEPAIDRNRAKWEEACARSRENGKKGGRPKTQNNPVGFSGFENKPTKTQRNPEYMNNDYMNYEYMNYEGYGGNENNIQGNPPAPPIEPLAVTTQTDLDAIIAEWNAQNCTRKIDKIPFGTRRYSNTMLCINNDLPNFLLTIRELDKQAWFAERSKRKDPLSYDWFSDPNNYIKVAEGNYKDLRQTQHEETQQERSMRILQEATE